MRWVFLTPFILAIVSILEDMYFDFLTVIDVHQVSFSYLYAHDMIENIKYVFLCDEKRTHILINKRNKFTYNVQALKHVKSIILPFMRFLSYFLHLFK